MVVDSSALLAILFGEPEKNEFARLIRFDEAPMMSAVNFFEACMASDSRIHTRGDHVSRLVRELGITLVAFSPDHADRARQAWLRFGKGNHPAKLNMGDCCAYATAMIAREPLLYKGGDFAQTDIAAVL
ncbi:MAG: type II toxin-antitoxin system VapC family toxin [Bryobacteraceae bacterium]|nr:type II toxin-antitoxin system VapC family toxin [Bryobacteraceae bacterium]